MCTKYVRITSGNFAGSPLFKVHYSFRSEYDVQEYENDVLVETHEE